MSEVRSIVEQLTEVLDTGGRLLALMDFDGTLTPIVADPAKARLSPTVRESLRVLSRDPRIKVGIISGRDLRDLRDRVGIAEVIYAGCHGLEVEGPGLAFLHPQAEARRETIQAIAAWLTRRAASVPGMSIEVKRLSAAVHYRHVSHRALSRLMVQIEQALCQYPGSFKILQGKKVIEILPHVGWNKGECALWIRDYVFSDIRPAATMLYIGDDRTDEQAFLVLSDKAITARVGGGEARSASAYQLRDFAEVQRMLSALAANVSGREAP